MKKMAGAVASARKETNASTSCDPAVVNFHRSIGVATSRRFREWEYTGAYARMAYGGESIADHRLESAANRSQPCFALS
jgi:predicted HAD superfamily Cof-like phosphohydrolase